MISFGKVVKQMVVADKDIKGPTMPAGSAISGLGGTTQSCLGRKPVLVKNPEGQTALIRPDITSAPLNLWGRGVLSAWGVQVGMDL